jgi:flagellin
MLSLNTNMNSLVAQTALYKSSAQLSQASQRLATGYRINSARDDAAGLAIATGMTAQIQGLTQAVRNANDGMSMAQTAEGALQETTNNLLRIRELTVQAASGTNSTVNLADIQQEIGLRLKEIDRIAQQTTFNNIAVLEASGGAVAGSANAAINFVNSVTFQVGALDAQSIGVTINSVDSTALVVNALDVTVAYNPLTPPAAGTPNATPLAQIDAALSMVSTQRSIWGATQNQFYSVSSNLMTTVDNLSQARSQIQDADFAAESSNFTKANILQQAGYSALAQANIQPQAVLALLPK